MSLIPPNKTPEKYVYAILKRCYFQKKKNSQAAKYTNVSLRVEKPPAPVTQEAGRETFCQKTPAERNTNNVHIYLYHALKQKEHTQKCITT